jgi:hypothetical protein
MLSGKAMRLKSSALTNLILRLKLAVNPATQLFFVALFVFGLINSYFVKSHRQYAGKPDVEKYQPNPAIVFVRTDGDRVLPLSTPWGPFKSPNPHHAP